METNSPKKRRSPSRRPDRKELPRESKTVEHAPTEKPELTVETPIPPENKYAPKEKIGRPSITRAQEVKITSVGLGNLEVETYGNRTYL